MWNQFKTMGIEEKGNCSVRKEERDIIHYRPTHVDMYVKL